MTHITVNAAAHPFKLAREVLRPEVGLSLEQILILAQPDPALRHLALIDIEGHPVPKALWGRVRPKAGAVVTLRCQLGRGGGGGGKNPLRTVLSLALMVATPGLGAALGSSIFGSFGALGGMLGKGLVSLIGGAVIGAIAPTPKPKLNDLSPAQNRDSATLYIEGARNQKKPFGPVPVVLGRHRMFPPMAADTYTETVSDAQFVRQAFCWGYGRVEVSDLKIGDTALSAFTDVETQFIDGSNTTAPEFTLYPNDVQQDNYSILLSHAAGWQLRTTAIETDEIMLDVTFPQGLVHFDGAGNRQPYSVTLKGRYAPTGTTAWVDFINTTITRNFTSSIRETFRVVVPRGQYDVQIMRETADTTDTQIFDDVFWTALKSIKTSSPILMPRTANTVLRMKATDQLNGAVDEFNGVVQTVCWDWDQPTGTWIVRATSNPASLYRYVLQGPMNPKPKADSDLILPDFIDWHNFCAANNLTFNAVYDFETRLNEVLRDVASAGRASAAIVDSRYTVVIDRAQTTPRQHFTPRNSWGYSCEIVFPEVPHAFRVQFVNKDKLWQQDERIVYDDGYSAATATVYQTLELFGVTDATHAYKTAREKLAELRLRRELHQFSVDVEHIVATRGDLIKFAHDVIAVGVCQGRVKSLVTSGSNTTGLVLDEQVEMQAGKNYAVRVRLKDSSSILLPVINTPGNSNEVNFVTPVVTVSGPQVDDLVLVGETGLEALDLIITSIAPDKDFSARITAVAHAPEIWAASAGTIPAFESGITVPVERTRPLPPVIASVQSDENAIIRSADGSLVTRIVVNLTNPNAGFVEPVVRLRRVDETSFVPAVLDEARPERVAIKGVQDAATYNVEIAYRRVGSSILSSQLISPYTALTHTVVGKTRPPSDVTGFYAQQNGEVVLMRWAAIADIDADGYEIRRIQQLTAPTQEQLNDAWVLAGANVVKIAEYGNELTSAEVPPGKWTLLIKARDTSGNLSVNAASCQLDMVAEFGDSVTLPVGSSGPVEAWPLWQGIKTNLMVHPNTYVLMPVSTLAASATDPFAEFCPSPALPMVYETQEIDLTLTALRDAANARVYSIRQVQGSDGVAVNSADAFSLKTRKAADVISSEWQLWAQGRVTARWLQGKVELVEKDGVCPVLERFAISADVPPREIRLNNQSIAVGGTAITYDPPFMGEPNVQVTPKGGTPKFAVLTAQDETGSTLQLVDLTATDVGGAADIFVKGI